jgi:hypothetical protein
MPKGAIETDDGCWSQVVVKYLVGTARARLTKAGQCSTFVLMEVETLGMARSLAWKVHMRCANGYPEGTKSMRRCVYRKQLDLETLVCTRGPNFPLSRLESRLMCPACGSRRVTVVFETAEQRAGALAGDGERLPSNHKYKVHRST